MTLRELLEMQEIKPELTFKKQWGATLKNCEISGGGFLTHISGMGPTAKDALKDMLSQILGQRIVVNAYTDCRREFNVPDTVELGDLE